MDEMPYSLQTLPPEAVDILRYYADAGVESAHADSIIDGASLSERGFGKGIRRLVTKNYVAMSTDQVYRLTDAGRRVLEELKTTDSDSPRGSSQQKARFVRRHLVLVAPSNLTADQPTEVTLAFEESEDDEYLNAPASLLLRLSLVNGEPHLPRAAAVTLTNRQMQQKFEISAGRYANARVRVEVCQYQNDGDDFDFCGGMYVDLPVSANPNNPAFQAYGVDITLKEE